jgi:putative membrane protein
MKQPMGLIVRKAAAAPSPAYAFLLACLYLVGTLGHLWPQTRAPMAAMTPWFLLATGGAALLLALPERGRPAFLAWVAVCYLITFGLEVLGVATGKVFGAYRYGPVLGFHILDVPPVIGFNWVMLILAFSDLASLLPRGRLYGPLLAAAAATGFDWVMEPAAIGLGYWTWAGGDIPLRNYAAWFLIALAFSAAHSALGLRSRRMTPAILAAAQAVFFGILRLALFP